MNYQIKIGKVVNAETGKEEPATTHIINDDQYRILLMFADQMKDENLNTTFKLNNCLFTVDPYFGDK